MSLHGAGAARGAAATLVTLLGLCGATSAVAQTGLAPVLVRTYNSFGVTAEDLDAATRHAARLLADAGVTSAWRDCRTSSGPSKGSASCDDLPLRFELIVRIVPAGAAAGGDVALGEAHVDAGTGRGALATVFGDRVDAVAVRTGVTRATLLGRVLAHEVGHLLLGAHTHSPHGLMRARWPVERLGLANDDDWRFAPDDVERLRQILTARALSVNARNLTFLPPPQLP